MKTTIHAHVLHFSHFVHRCCIFVSCWTRDQAKTAGQGPSQGCTRHYFGPSLNKISGKLMSVICVPNDSYNIMRLSTFCHMLKNTSLTNPSPWSWVRGQRFVSQAKMIAKIAIQLSISLRWHRIDATKVV